MWNKEQVRSGCTTGRPSHAFQVSAKDLAMPVVELWFGKIDGGVAVSSMARGSAARAILAPPRSTT